jgi:DNA polymerase III delta prime subunit
MTQSRSKTQPLPPHAAHPGFAIAQAWCDRHRPRPGLTEALAATVDQPPRLPCDDVEGFDDALGDPSPRRKRRESLPLELTLILTFARALHAAGGHRPGAPAQLALVHGWGGAVVSELQDILSFDAIAHAFLEPARDRALILTLAQGEAGDRAQAERRRTLASQITKALMAGRGVIALGAAPADLPGDLRRLYAQELRLPRPDRAMVTALLTLLFPENADILIPDSLPPEDALARLTPLELTSGLHAGSLSAALVALHRLSAPELSGTQPGGVSGLDAVAGQDAAVAVLHRLAADITAWRAGKLSWSAVPRSLIFHGPPGTGKTLMAQAFAAETGLPLIATSFADCQKAGHLGDMLATLESTVAEAEARAPAVFFLDELDGFSTREASNVGRNKGYMRAVITGLLRQLDRLMATEGVVIMAATNHLRAVDPAIRRAGRFDATLLIDPPDRAGLAQILRQHLDAPADPALDKAIALATERLVGTNGAEAAALARAALARQRESHGPLAEALRTELDARQPGLTMSDQRRVALHEAGHVVVGVLSGLPDPKALRLTPEGGDVRWPNVPIHTLDTAYAELRMVLAGRAAEEVFFGAPSSSAGVGPESDLAMATRLVLRIETEWGMGDGGLTWLPGMPITLQGLPWLRAKVDHLLTNAQSQARAIIATHRREVEALADALMEAREMKGEALQEWVGTIRDRVNPPRQNLALIPDISATVVPLE